MKLTTTFKVHKSEGRGHADPARATEERILLHPIDPHEPGVNELVTETHSGFGQIKLVVNAEAALGRFVPGQLVTVTFEIPDLIAL